MINRAIIQYDVYNKHWNSFFLYFFKNICYIYNFDKSFLTVDLYTTVQKFGVGIF